MDIFYIGDFLQEAKCQNEDYLLYSDVLFLINVIILLRIKKSDLFLLYLTST